MKVQFKKESGCTGKIKANRKEKSFYASHDVIALIDGKLTKVVDCRLYGTNTIYCCIWVNGTSYYCSGGGNAGGCGYHKESAAVSEAISDAGIKLETDIAGVGDSAIRKALLAIAKAVYPDCETMELFSSHA